MISFFKNEALFLKPILTDAISHVFNRHQGLLHQFNYQTNSQVSSFQYQISL